MNDYQKAVVAARTAMVFLLDTFPDCAANEFGSDIHYLESAVDVLVANVDFTT